MMVAIANISLHRWLTANYQGIIVEHIFNNDWIVIQSLWLAELYFLDAESFTFAAAIIQQLISLP